MQTSYAPLLSRLLGLRLFMSALGTTVLFLAWVFNYPLALFPMLFVLGLHAISGLIYLGRLRQQWEPSEPEMLIQLSLDVLALLSLLYFSGGASNPFISLLLLPIAIASSLLRQRWVAILAIEACIGYLLLLVEYWPLPPISHSPQNQFWQHQLGMAANFVLTAMLLSGFVAWLTHHLREREAEIVKLRETAQRQEQLLGVATLAAGAAHELGTPLNTIHLLIEERLADAPGIEARADLIMMQQQVNTCRAVLSRLSVAAQEYEENVIDIHATLRQLFDHWLAMRPQVRAEFDWPDTPSPQAYWSPLLDQALLNLCNNAADASPEAIHISVRWHTLLEITIDDHGPGPTPAMLAATPSPVKSDKAGGLGLGVWLSNATLERFNGRVCYTPRSQGGTRTTVEIPLRAEA